MNPFPLEITRLANNGCGVGTSPDGKTAFVSGAVPGDRILAETTAEHQRFRECRIEAILTPSGDRIASDCSAAEDCGGCCFRHITYESELRAKEGFVRDAFTRVGAVEVSPEPILPSPVLSAYRNKVEFAVDGMAAGFYSEKTHRIIPAEACPVVPPEFIPIRDRVSDMGLPIHHLVLRRSGLNGSIMLILVSDRTSLENEAGFADILTTAFPMIQTIILNTNPESGGQVLGTRNRVLSGSGTIRDRICSVPVEIGPLSFFQVNTPAAEVLYQTAGEFAAVRLDDVILDLYCGMGTIGLSLAADCRQLIGCEIIPEAVASAERNAAEMGFSHTRFLCGDAGKAALRLEREALHPTLVILDPPRRGCSAETLNAVSRMAPERIVMISCDPVTAARDVKLLGASGYELLRLRPVDLFPRTRHVETVCLLQRRA